MLRRVEESKKIFKKDRSINTKRDKDMCTQEWKCKNFSYVFIETREYWMIYGGPGFIAVAWIGSSPTPSLPYLPSVSSTSDTQEDWERDGRERGEGVRGRGANSYDGEKAWSSIQHSTLSDWDYIQKTCFWRGCYVNWKKRWWCLTVQRMGDFRIEERVKDRGSWGRLVLSGVSISVL